MNNSTIKTIIKNASITYGSKTKLAKALGISPQYLYAIEKTSKTLPIKTIPVSLWEEVLGLPKEMLFPHIFT